MGSYVRLSGGFLFKKGPWHCKEAVVWRGVFFPFIADSSEQKHAVASAVQDEVSPLLFSHSLSSWSPKTMNSLLVTSWSLVLQCCGNPAYFFASCSMSLVSLPVSSPLPSYLRRWKRTAQLLCMPLLATDSSTSQAFF